MDLFCKHVCANSKNAPMVLYVYNDASKRYKIGGGLMHILRSLETYLLVVLVTDSFLYRQRQYDNQCIIICVQGVAVIRLCERWQYVYSPKIWYQDQYRQVVCHIGDKDTRKNRHKRIRAPER